VNRKVIHKILAGRLSDGFSLMPHVQFENTKYTPDDSQPWAEEKFVPNDSNITTLGLTGEMRDIGYFQVNVYVPINTGTFESDEYIDELSELFHHGLIIEDLSHEVRITKVTPTEGFSVDNWYVVPLTIYWECTMNIN